MKLHQFFFLRLREGFFNFPAWDFATSVVGAEGAGRSWKPQEDEVGWFMFGASCWCGWLIPTAVRWAVEWLGMHCLGDSGCVAVRAVGQQGNVGEELWLLSPSCGPGDDAGGVRGCLISLSPSRSSLEGTWNIRNISLIVDQCKNIMRCTWLPVCSPSCSCFSAVSRLRACWARIPTSISPSRPSSSSSMSIGSLHFSFRCQAWLLFGVMFTSSLVKAHMQICYNPSFPSFYPKQLICTAFKLQFRHDKSHTKSRGES